MTKQESAKSLRNELFQLWWLVVRACFAEIFSRTGKMADPALRNRQVNTSSFRPDSQKKKKKKDDLF